ISGGTRGMETMMNRCPALPLFLFFIFLLHPAYALSVQITIDSEDQFQFARQSMERGAYLRAVAEFERFIHFFPQDEKVPQAHYLVGFCYLKAKEYASARKALENVYESYSLRPVAGKALFLLGESYYREGLLREAQEYFKKVIETYPHLDVKHAAQYRLAWSRMKADNWREASETFMRVEKGSPLYPHSQDLAKLSLKGEALPYKKPATAGVLAILPGLGHLYCERPKDALVSFLLNGLTIWAAIEAFDEDLEVLGGLLLLLEVGWYAGNIYSAVNSAHKYNRKVRNDFRRSIPDRLNLNLFATRGGLGLALKMDF
ncbi:MAG: tetratricopeptide repeat protein, partial [Desulfobacteraceae bacterium]